MITIAILGALTGWWRRRKGKTPEVVTAEESRARIQELRTRGYRVQTVRLPGGTRAVLRSREPVLSRG